MLATFTPLLAEGGPPGSTSGSPARDCRIAGFAGRQVFLAVADDLFAEGDVQPGYLLLDGGGEHLQAVRGRAEWLSPGTAVMHLTDTFSGQRRVFSRAPLVLLRRASELTLGMSFVRIASEHRAMLAELALACHRA